MPNYNSLLLFTEVPSPAWFLLHSERTRTTLGVDRLPQCSGHGRQLGGACLASGTTSRSRGAWCLGGPRSAEGVHCKGLVALVHACARFLCERNIIVPTVHEDVHMVGAEQHGAHRQSADLAAASGATTEQPAPRACTRHGVHVRVQVASLFQEQVATKTLSCSLSCLGTVS